MIRLLTDENFDRRIVLGLLLRLPELDWVTVQSAGLAGSTDDQILVYAAQTRRVVVTHDVRTMTKDAIHRVRKNLYFPGLIVVPDVLDIGTAISDLQILIECATEEEFQNRIYFLPA